MSEILKLEISGNPDYIQIAKMAVGAAASTAGFDIEHVEDIELAVAEACKNITCHGFDGWSECYEITCRVNDARMEITVTDIKCEHSVSKGKRPCLDCPKEGDLGIFVIKSLMDEVEITKEKQGNRSIKMVRNRC